MGLANIGAKLGGIIALTGVIVLIYGITQMGNFEQDAVWKGTGGETNLAKGKFQVWYRGDEYSQMPSIIIRDSNNVAVFSSNMGTHPRESMSIMNDEYAKAGTFETVISGNYTITQGSTGTRLYIMRDTVSPGLMIIGAGFAMMFLGIVIYAICARIRQGSSLHPRVNTFGGRALPPQHGYDIGNVPEGAAPVPPQQGYVTAQGPERGAPLPPVQGSTARRAPDRAISRPPGRQYRRSSGPEVGQMAEPKPLEDESQLKMR